MVSVTLLKVFDQVTWKRSYFLIFIKITGSIYSNSFSNERKCVSCFISIQNAIKWMVRV